MKDKKIIVTTMKKKFEIAICYDFDGTLAAGNMQEYGFLKKLGIKPSEFWNKSDSLAQEANADHVLCYMKCMLDAAKAKNIVFTKDDFANCGKDIKLFAGVEDWFERINKYAAKKGVKVNHYLISSGLTEIVEGTSIAKYFEQMYACSFMYNGYGEALWPARIVNYTDKTQYLFRINKGCLDPNDEKSVNKLMPLEDRPMPFSRMIYLGDGDTDIPSMAMVKSRGGHCIAVYQPKKKGAATKAQKYLDDGRANFIAPADYSADKKIDKCVKYIIDKLVAEQKLNEL